MTTPLRLHTETDGHKNMPKLKCPYGNHRFADVPDKELRNKTILKKADSTEASDADFFFECPICHKKIAASISVLHNEQISRLCSVPLRGIIEV